MLTDRRPGTWNSTILSHQVKTGFASQSCQDMFQFHNRVFTMIVFNTCSVAGWFNSWNSKTMVYTMPPGTMHDRQFLKHHLFYTHVACHTCIVYYSSNSLTRSSLEWQFKFLLSGIHVIKFKHHVQFVLGTEKIVLVIRNFLHVKRVLVKGLC